jgi:hypothetical protein
VTLGAQIAKDYLGRAAVVAIDDNAMTEPSPAGAALPFVPPASDT